MPAVMKSPRTWKLRTIPPFLLPLSSLAPLPPGLLNSNATGTEALARSRSGWDGAVGGCGLNECLKLATLFDLTEV